jgi:hypothetical protein
MSRVMQVTSRPCIKALSGRESISAAHPVARPCIDAQTGEHMRDMNTRLCINAWTGRWQLSRTSGCPSVHQCMDGSWQIMKRCNNKNTYLA